MSRTGHSRPKAFPASVHLLTATNSYKDTIRVLTWYAIMKNEHDVLLRNQA